MLIRSIVYPGEPSSRERLSAGLVATRRCPARDNSPPEERSRGILAVDEDRQLVGRVECGQKHLQVVARHRRAAQIGIAAKGLAKVDEVCLERPRDDLRRQSIRIRLSWLDENRQALRLVGGRRSKLIRDP